MLFYNQYEKEPPKYHSTCGINLFVGYFDIAFAAKGFIVEKGGSNKILVTDGISQYVIEHDYNCYNSDFYDGRLFILIPTTPRVTEIKL